MRMLGAALAALLAAFLLLLMVPPPALAVDHVVGVSMWSIPPSGGLYSTWAANRTFYVGDNLVFRFGTGFYNVAQVSRREYEDCTADDPYGIFDTGPAIVALDAKGVRYFLCSIGNYCSLGVKLYVTINPR